VKMSTMMNYQNYNKNIFLKEFYNTDWFKQLKADYKHLYSDKIDIRVPYESIKTVRQRLNDSSIFLYSVCYYLEFLLEKNPTVIADIGCGENLIKRYLPNVVGFDKTAEADVQEWFDDEFILKHSNEFDCAFAVNSLHYTSLKNVKARVNDFGKIIKKDGRGFITLNLQRLLENTEPHEYHELFDLSSRLTLKDYEEFLVQELTAIDYQILAFDILLNDENIDDWFNGNIRLVFKV